MDASRIAGKARIAVTDALNGDYDSVDPAVRRSLLALATELDEHVDRVEIVHAEILVELDKRAVVIEKSLSRVQTLLISTSVMFLTTLVTATVSLLY